MRVCGIDLSTHAVDLVTIELDTNELQWHRYHLTGDKAWPRTLSVRDAMPTRTSELWDDVAEIAIEQPAGNYGVLVLTRVQGAVLSCLPSVVPTRAYVPARWRVLNGLPGHALKAAVMERSLELGGLHSWPQDAHDAHLIARAILADLDAQQAA